MCIMSTWLGSWSYSLSHPVTRRDWLPRDLPGVPVTSLLAWSQTTSRQGIRRYIMHSARHQMLCNQRGEFRAASSGIAHYSWRQTDRRGSAEAV
ncbi:hypothetical protein F4781DRAFT_62213 [Annulohypoxylon bovei var. microspora]|nr:hypothetical protein F4781DRAFT_62213 [Annulohypoxylon bovei var. microspora]